MAYSNPEDKKAWRKDYKLRFPEKHKQWRLVHDAKAKTKAAQLREQKNRISAINQVPGAINEIRKRIMKRDRIKVCSKCGKTQSYDNFRPISIDPKRRQSWCKTCEISSVIKWQKSNPDKTKQYSKITIDRIKENPAKMLKLRIRGRINKAIKLHGRGVHVEGGKLRYLGCTASEAVAHIERQMNSRMTWDNYGRAWHVDHIYPIAAYDLTKEEDRRKAFHYTNLQPLWARANVRKGDRITKQIHQPELILT